MCNCYDKPVGSTQLVLLTVLLEYLTVLLEYIYAIQSQWQGSANNWKDLDTARPAFANVYTTVVEIEPDLS